MDSVKGLVVAIAVTEVVMQGEGLSERVTERVKETVTDLVKGCVVATALRVTVIEVESVGS